MNRRLYRFTALSLMLWLASWASIWAQISLFKPSWSLSNTETVLENGVRVSVRESSDAEVASVVFLFDGGLRGEESGEEGMNYFVVELLRDRLDQNRALEEAGANIGVGVESDYSYIIVTILPEYLSEVGPAVHEALTQVAVDEQELEAKKSELIQNWDMGLLGGSNVAQVFRQLFYQYHPYRRTQPTSRALLQKMDLQRLKRFLASDFGSEKIVVGVISSLSQQEAVGDLRKSLETLPRGVVSSQRFIPWRFQAGEQEKELSSGRGVGYVMVGFEAPSLGERDFLAVQLLASVLGEGISSRWFDEVRERRSLAYSVSVDAPALLGPAYFFGGIATQPRAAGKVKRLMLKEVERLAEEGLTDKQLEAAKWKLKGELLAGRQSLEQKTKVLAVSMLADYPEWADRRILRAVDSLTRERVNQVAKEYLQERFVVVARPPGFYFD